MRFWLKLPYRPWAEALFRMFFALNFLGAVIGFVRQTALAPSRQTGHCFYSSDRSPHVGGRSCHENVCAVDGAEARRKRCIAGPNSQQTMITWRVVAHSEIGVSHLPAPDICSNPL